MSDVEKLKEKPQEKLMRVIYFTEEDLAANREGHISEPQRARFIFLRQFWLVCLILAMGIGITIAILAVINGISHHDAVSDHLSAIGLIAIVTSVIVFYISVKLKRLDGDLNSRHIEVIEGRIQLDLDGQDYHIVIQNISLRVPKRIFLVFKNGDPYIIYYAPHTKTILSAEWLREE